MGEYNDDEGAALGCKSEGGAWKEVRVAVSMHARDGVKVVPQWCRWDDSVGFEQGVRTRGVGFLQGG